MKTEWQKYMDRAIQECDKKTADLLEMIPPQVAAVMLIQIGKRLCDDDEWAIISKQLKPTWGERIRWIFSYLKPNARNADTSGS